MWGRTASFAQPKQEFQEAMDQKKQDNKKQ
jgi:hypothetical protein